MSSSILIYQDKENNVYTEVQLENETIWLSQGQLADLFKKSSHDIPIVIQVLTNGECGYIHTRGPYQ